MTHGSRKEARGRSIRFPISRNRGKAPKVAGGVPTNSHHPKFVALPWRQIAGHVSSNTSTAGQVVNAQPHTGLERARKTYATAKRIYKKCMTTFCKRCGWIQAGDAHWNLRPYAGPFSTLNESLHEPAQIVCRR
jgi:hypothetical protein